MENMDDTITPTSQARPQPQARPFGGPDYRKNADRAKGDETPCAICGRPIKPDSPQVFVLVGDGGGVFLPAGSGETHKNDAGFMGGFPVGLDCFRAHRTLFEGLGYTAPKRGGKAKMADTTTITEAEAKKIVKAALDERKLTYTRLKARTTNLTIGGKTVFVEVYGFQPHPAWDEVTKIGRDHGFRVERGDHV